MLDEAAEIGMLLFVANGANRRAVDEALRDFGTNIAQITVLRLIAEQPGLSNSELAERGARTAPSMGTLVAPLISRALVVRKRSGHRMEHFLSGDGGRLLAECFPIVRDVLASRLSTLSARDRAILLRLLRRLVPREAPG